MGKAMNARAFRIPSWKAVTWRTSIATVGSARSEIWPVNWVMVSPIQNLRKSASLMRGAGLGSWGAAPPVSPLGWFSFSPVS
jgi:hypothetical protein